MVKNKSLLQQALESLIENDKIEGAEVMAYSGRGMYGRECLGLAMNQSLNPMTLGAKVAVWAADRGLDPWQLEEDLSSFYSDSLGKGVVYYWRQIKYVGP